MNAQLPRYGSKSYFSLLCTPYALTTVASLVQYRAQVDGAHTATSLPWQHWFKPTNLFLHLSAQALTFTYVSAKSIWWPRRSGRGVEPTETSPERVPKGNPPKRESPEGRRGEKKC